MDDAQKKLLADHKTIILPEDIDHDTYKTTMFYADDLIKMGMALPIADRRKKQIPIDSTYNPPPLKSNDGQ